MFSFRFLSRVCTKNCGEIAQYFNLSPKIFQSFLCNSNKFEFFNRGFLVGE